MTHNFMSLWIIIVFSVYYIIVFAIYFLFVGVLQELPFQILMQLITKVIIWGFNLLYFLTPKDEKKEDETEYEVKAVCLLIYDITFTFFNSFLFIDRFDFTFRHQ